MKVFVGGITDRKLRLFSCPFCVQNNYQNHKNNASKANGKQIKGIAETIGRVRKTQQSLRLLGFTFWS